MIRHEHFDLLLHTNGELGAYLGGEVAVRTTLHEWPLSCVQRIMLYCGRRVIYKAQAGPTVESAFYAAARSPLLIPAETIFAADGYTSILFPYIEAPLLTGIHLDVDDALAIGWDLMRQIADIRGKVPHWLDIQTERKWLSHMDEMVQTLSTLVAAGNFQHVTAATVKTIARWAESAPVLAAIRGPSCLVHGDLCGNNILVTPKGYRVLDWQHPLLGPPDVDMATLLDSLAIDPRTHVEAGVVDIMYLLRIDWLVQCAQKWFVAGCAAYDAQIADICRHWRQAI